jgi:redox-sensing transcriptional repressor
VSDVGDMARLIPEHKISIAVITVPSSAAQMVCDEVVESGVKAILNFAPVNLRVPDEVFLRNENMAIELEHLSFSLRNQELVALD